MNQCSNWLAVALLALTSATGRAQQLLNLPMPTNGLRYTTYEQLDIQWPTNHGAGSVCLWGDDKFAPVSFTIDDNNVGDFPLWRQASQTYGWKFTWFVIVYPYMWDIYNNVPGNNTGYYGTAALFKTLYDEGHEVELHGSCGPMNTLSPAAYEDHVLRSIAHLESGVSNNITTFAYPCGTLDPGDGTKSYETVIGSLLIGARGTTGGATAPAIVDYLNTHSMGTATNTGAGSSWDKMNLRSPANILYSAYRGWAVVLNHKVNDTNGFTSVLNFVKTNEFRYWVKPFGHVARYAQERESSTLTITNVTPSKIEFNLTDLMRDDLFNVPLTVKFRVTGWTAAAARQNGVAVPARLVTTNGATYALVDAVPDRGRVTLRALGPDADGDGMADIWETEHGLNPGSSSDAALDRDGDGQSNLAEFLADTNPTNAASWLATWVEPQSNGFAFACTPASLWATSIVECSTNPINWSPLAPTQITQTNNIARWTDADPLANQKFYRLRLTP
jgi:peptidoglycan/xylan/chitin deacetylase (PgdA/CDA1 family)